MRCENQIELYVRAAIYVCSIDNGTKPRFLIVERVSRLMRVPLALADAHYKIYLLAWCYKCHKWWKSAANHLVGGIQNASNLKCVDVHLLLMFVHPIVGSWSTICTHRGTGRLISQRVRQSAQMSNLASQLSPYPPTPDTVFSFIFLTICIHTSCHHSWLIVWNYKRHDRDCVSKSRSTLRW